MGLKFRLGLAVGGLLMSSMFGTNMLFGIKDYVDTTGNIMVDIADGISMISTVSDHCIRVISLFIFIVYIGNITNLLHYTVMNNI